MAAIVILTFLVLIGPLALLYGVDSRRVTDRGWMAAPRRATRRLD
jgi:hypothetical protein